MSLTINSKLFTALSQTWSTKSGIVMVDAGLLIGTPPTETHNYGFVRPGTMVLVMGLLNLPWLKVWFTCPNDLFPTTEDAVTAIANIFGPGEYDIAIQPAGVPTYQFKRGILKVFQEERNLPVLVLDSDATFADTCRRLGISALTDC